MIAYQKFLALALLTSLLLIHCGGGGSSSTTQIPPSPPVARAVYAVGDANPGSGINHIAANVVWKNGAVLWALPTNTDVWSVAVNGSDVYVTGSLYNPNTYTSTYTIWKNGVANTALSPIPNLYIPAIATSGNDVYAVGDANPGSGINHIAANVVWKNGAVLWALPTNTDVWSVAVNGGDVYVAGSLYNPNTYTSTYTIWKNGVANTALSPIPNLYIPAIATSGNDVYAVGDANPGSGINHIVANVVWKNGAVLWALPTNTDVWSIAVNGSDVYVAGSLYNPNTYTSTYTIWKNGVANTALSPIPNLYIPAIATSGN